MTLSFLTLTVLASSRSSTAWLLRTLTLRWRQQVRWKRWTAPTSCQAPPLKSTCPHNSWSVLSWCFSQLPTRLLLLSLPASSKGKPDQEGLLPPPPWTLTAFTSTPSTPSWSVTLRSGECSSKTLCWLGAAPCLREWGKEWKKKYKPWLPPQWHLR